MYVKDQREGSDGSQLNSSHGGSVRPFDSRGNTQAVDRLDMPLLPLESATPAQPAVVVIGPTSSDVVNYQILARKAVGVDDGFRTRDLRIHNPAL